MNSLKYILLLIYALVLLEGCQPTSAVQDKQKANADFIQGIHISDLQESVTTQIDGQAMLAFRIYTFAVDPEEIGKLRDVADILSQKNLRYANKEALNANGIGIGTAPYQKGSDIIQRLQQMGAELAAQANLSFPPDVTEILTSNPIEGAQTILYSTSEAGLATANVEQGNLGWIITAHSDPSQPDLAQVKFEPAFWHTGLEDLRFKIKKEIYDFYKFNTARFLVRMTLGDIVVIAPAREQVPIQQTLDKYLFYAPGSRPKVKIFVVVCHNTGIQ